MSLGTLDIHMGEKLKLDPVEDIYIPVIATNSVPLQLGHGFHMDTMYIPAQMIFIWACRLL